MKIFFVTNSEKELIGEEVAPEAASHFVFAGSAPADKSVLNARNLLQAFLKLLFHLQQKERKVFSQTNRSKRRKQQECVLKEADFKCPTGTAV